MISFTAAPTQHNGYEFVAVLVAEHAVDSPTLREDLLEEAARVFHVDPVLVSEERFRTYGAQRAVSTLRTLSLEQLPWQQYRLQ